MYVLSAKLIFYIPHANSLKDKRQISRSLIEKTRKRYNVAIAEINTQDIHRILSLGIAVISGDMTHAQQSLDEVIRFMEMNEEAELREIEEF